MMLRLFVTGIFTLIFFIEGFGQLREFGVVSDFGKSKVSFNTYKYDKNTYSFSFDAGVFTVIRSGPGVYLRAELLYNRLNGEHIWANVPVYKEVIYMFPGTTQPRERIGTIISEIRDYTYDNISLPLLLGHRIGRKMEVELGVLFLYVISKVERISKTTEIMGEVTSTSDRIYRNEGRVHMGGKLKFGYKLSNQASIKLSTFLSCSYCGVEQWNKGFLQFAIGGEYRLFKW